MMRRRGRDLWEHRERYRLDLLRIERAHDRLAAGRLHVDV